MAAATKRSRPADPASAGGQAADFSLPTLSDALLVRHLVPAYVVLLVVAEVVASLTANVVPWCAPVVHGAVLLLLLVHAGLYGKRPYRLLPLTLACAPAARLFLWLGAPAARGSPWRLLCLAVPLLAAGVVAGWVLGLRLQVSALRLRAAALWMVLPGLRWRLRPLWSRLPDLHGYIRSRRVRPAGPPRYGRAFSLRRTGPPGVAALRVGALLLAGLAIVLGTGGDGLLALGQPPARTSRPVPQPDRRRGGRGPALGLPAAGRVSSVLDGLEIRLDMLVRIRPGSTTEPRAAGRPAGPGPAEPVPSADGEYPGCPAAGYENPYAWGVCTWYAKEKRPDLPAFQGDAGMAVNWPHSAGLCGFRVDQQPAVRAVIVFPPGANGADWGGHVAYVEEVAADSILISECNVTHNRLFNQPPWWWEGEYACAFRRITFARLDPGVVYIQGKEDPSASGKRASPQASRAAKEKRPYGNLP